MSPRLVHQRRRGLARREHVGDDRQFLEVDDYLGGDVLRLGARVGDAHGDHLAHVAHLVGRQRRLLGGLEAGQRRNRADRLHPRHVRGGEDRALVRFGRVDGEDARVRHGAAHEGDVREPGQFDVGDELAAPAHVAVVFLANQAGADPFFTHLRVSVSPLAPPTRGAVYQSRSMWSFTLSPR